MGFSSDPVYTLVTQPMLQRQPNWTELRSMVSKSIFNVDSKNVDKWSSNVIPDFFFKTYLGGPKGKNLKRHDGGLFFLKFLESTLKMDLESINLSSVEFRRRCNIGWVTSGSWKHCQCKLSMVTKYFCSNLNFLFYYKHYFKD